jgi:hypothetical protein
VQHLALSSWHLANDGASRLLVFSLGVLLRDTFEHNEAGEARSDLFDTSLGRMDNPVSIYCGIAGFV